MKMSAKRKTPSRKKESSAAAVKPVITKLYEGTADLIIKIPQNPKKNTGKTAPETPEPAKELIEITLPPAAKTADENDRIAALASALISCLLKDIEATKQTNRKSLQAKGITRAKAAGTQFGRPKKELPETFYEAAELCRAGKISITEGAERSGMTYWAFYYRIKNTSETDKNR